MRAARRLAYCSRTERCQDGARVFLDAVWTRFGLMVRVLAFLKEQGRMKFVRPLYKDLFGWEEQRELAVATFMELREGYHPIAVKMLSADLHISS